MLYQVKLRITQPWLGSQKTPEQVRRFRKIEGGPKDGEIELDRVLWDWAYKQAVEALHFDDIDTGTIRAALSTRCPRLVLRQRKFTNQKNKIQEEMFESIPKNYVLTVDIMVTTVPETNKGKRAPTEGELHTILSFIGEKVGLSPWGSRFGYGTFTVESLDLI